MSSAFREKVEEEQFYQKKKLQRREKLSEIAKRRANQCPRVDIARYI